MTILESFASFVEVALLVLGWIGFAAIVLAPLAAFNQEVDAFQRIGLAVLFAAFWIVGVPVIYVAGGFVSDEIGEVFFANRFMGHVVFGLAAASFLARIVLDLLAYWFKIYEGRLLPRDQGLAGAIERTLEYMGAPALGAYFLHGAPLLGSIVGGIVGGTYIVFSNRWFIQENARRAALMPQTAHRLPPQPADLIAPQTGPAAPYTVPPRDIASGFDVPPQ